MVKTRRKKKNITTRGLLEEDGKIRDEINRRRRGALILFTDLEGSTPYKLQRGPTEAEVKIYRHNDAGAKIVEKYNGKVIKSLGDGIMATFEGKDAEIRAVKSAIKIQEEFREYNKRSKLPEIDRIKSKIGISSGEVSFWEIETHSQPDPQGTPVDIAARIVNLAKPCQILCSEEIKKRCPQKLKKLFSKPENRELKGIKGDVKICEILWEDEKGIDETVHFSVPDPQIESFLNNAWEVEGQGNYESAIAEYKHVLEQDPQHFIANLKLANILKNSKPNKAKDFVEKAIKSNPYSGAAKDLHGPILWRIKEREGDSLSNERLKSIIKDSEDALKLARKQADRMTEVIAMNNLAYFYMERYKRGKRNNEEWKRAKKLCEHARREYKKAWKERYSALLDTYGCVFMLKKNSSRKDLEGANKLFKESAKMYPSAPWPVKHRSQLLEIALQKGILLKDDNTS